jgi:heptosyltransferase-2
VRCFIGNAAGVTHLAARACPVVALFGPTDPAVWAPLGKRVTVLQAAGGDLGKLSVEAVAEAAAACMQRAGG